MFFCNRNSLVTSMLAPATVGGQFLLPFKAVFNRIRAISES